MIVRDTDNLIAPTCGWRITGSIFKLAYCSKTGKVLCNIKSEKVKFFLGCGVGF
jgi:hypothetical protein